MYHSSQSTFMPVASSNQPSSGDSAHSTMPILHRSRQEAGGSLDAWVADTDPRPSCHRCLLLAARFDGQADSWVPLQGGASLRSPGPWGSEAWGFSASFDAEWFPTKTSELQKKRSLLFCVLGMGACWHTTVWPQCWAPHWVPVSSLTFRGRDM